jgi:hypothetical protein
VLPFVQPIVRDLSKVCKNFLALEEENRQLSAQLKDVRRECCSAHLVFCSDDFASLLFNMMTRDCRASYHRQDVVEGPAGQSRDGEVRAEG